MVKEVPAFQAEDGSIHATRQEAVMADATAALKKLDIFNHGTILAVLGNAEALVDILRPVAKARRTDTVREDRVGEPRSETI